jgi:hypothetical protein
MLSKISDLERYKIDQKRFNLAIDSTEGEIQEEGRRLLAALNQAVSSFDSVMETFITEPATTRMDHATAQKHVAETKIALENWVSRHAPNIHVETAK